MLVKNIHNQASQLSTHIYLHIKCMFIFHRKENLLRKSMSSLLPTANTYICSIPL